MNRVKIEPNQIQSNVIDLIARQWMLITAGTADKFNTMTASWGGVGYLWNKPVAYIFIRPERYTYQFVESKSTFSLSFFGSEYKKILSLLGSKSGRDIDKMAIDGLTPYFTELGTPAFEQSLLTLECRKLYSTMLNEDDFVDSAQFKAWYGGEHGNLHRMYVGEIINVWVKE